MLSEHAKTYLAIAFLITGFLVGDAYGEDGVYYCAEIDKNGFKFDENLQVCSLLLLHIYLD